MTIRTIILVALLAACSARAREMGQIDISSDEFVKRFTASYGVLSEKEPPLTDIEIAILKKMGPIMRVDKAQAQVFLQSMTVADIKASASFNYLLGNVYFENDEYFLAEKEYKTAIEKFPDFQRAWTNLGILKLRSDDTRSALIALVRAVELGDRDAHTYGMLGYCHFREGNFLSAEVAYNMAMLNEPDNLAWLEGKAQVYLKSERYPEAIRMQDELIARDPNVQAYWLAQINAYLASNDLQSAARNLEIIRLMGKTDFAALYLLGGAYVKLGLTSLAADAFLDARGEATDARDIGYLAKSIKLLLSLGETEKARLLYESFDPDNAALDTETRVDLHYVAGEFASLGGDEAAAVASYEKAERLDPLNGQTLIRLASILAERDERDRAHYLLDRAQRDPDSEYNALLLKARLLIEDKRFEESKTYINRAMRLRSSEAIVDLYSKVDRAAADLAR